MTEQGPQHLSASSADALVAICAVQVRLARRWVRTWLFAILAFAAGFLVYLVFSVSHFYVGGVPPRLAMPGFGLVMLSMLLIGIVFVAFDARATDETARVVEVLDTRPISNIVLLAGRLLAAVLIVWLPLLALTLGLQFAGQFAGPIAGQIAGTVSESLEFPLGEAPEPVSLLTFVLLDAPVALAFWGALVTALVVVLRSCWVAAIVALALLGLHLYAIFNTPLYLLPTLSGITHLGLASSEILPRWPAGADVAARLATLACASGLLVVAAGVLPRRDDVSQRRRLAIGCGLVGAGAVAIAALAWQAQGRQDERLAWAQVHGALRDAPRLDVERIAGRVAIEPARRLAIRVEVTVRAPATSALDSLRFSLNPGMAVESVRVDGEAVTHSHQDGLLTVVPAQALQPEARVVVAIHASGIPDQRFGYLDNRVDAMAETLLGRPMVLMGEQASLFDENYVALTPSVRWLPAAGANFAAPADFHELALAVQLPSGWQAAGAGRTLSEGLLRFEPSVRIAEFALIAAPFERRALTVQGVECELLIHPMHMRNVELFAASGDGLVDRLRDRLQLWLSGQHAPAYPHDVISLVEAPAQLRRYGGGWFMDTVQALPGVQLMAEYGFPTSRFAEWPRPPSFSDEQWQDYLVAQIEYSGPHGIALTAGAARNLVPFLTRASGEGAVAVDYLVEWLTAWRLRGDRNVAPAHWLRVGLEPQQPPLLRALARAMGSATMASRWFGFFSMALEDRSEKLSFTGFDPASTQDGADILIHKGNLIALSIQRLLGYEKVTQFLALMHERHAGDMFTLDDFIQAMIDVDPAVAPFLEQVMGEQALPGFLASDARVDRLPDDAAGKPRFQIRVHVRNDESAAGIAGISYGASGDYFQWSPFAQVPGESAVEIGVISSEPPKEVRLETYLSLNRRIMRLHLAPLDTEAVVDRAPLNGVRPSDWRGPDIGIVVDDLDPGFATVSPPAGWSLGRLDAADAGTLPEFGRDTSQVKRWRRQADVNIMMWGKYRHTLARIAAGRGEGSASFTTALPLAGRWRLYYHLPGASLSEGHYMQGYVRRGNSWRRSADAFGDMHFKIIHEDDEELEEFEVVFDAAAAAPGWNNLGTYDLGAGRVQVVVSDATSGDIVVADAVRWERMKAQELVRASASVGQALPWR